ncbi:hypothetical protein T4B_10881 [Trichinella pseudospiralis]|uniref:Uncharacterized protein n=1 Tax=Trichinella pseudospiralis TaxID=6337 RepID=A0A0V1JMK2_TRIPS|nr:hypothetical protein T4B_10881 [Trichinella pseudospiralis]KRZ36171.1 hypothetical protein T4C_11104 [Trichinella pseudospiralis]
MRECYRQSLNKGKGATGPEAAVRTIQPRRRTRRSTPTRSCPVEAMNEPTRESGSLQFNELKNPFGVKN